ncbi:spore coat protein U domain-containing protein [Ciceribacter lividus]|uniref:spore coat protein U domain-containing protein n=1 Tax=Ciceribacter lividus TaxID=1197950 RepID=UPI000DF2A4C7|nr:spore coat protein U domain-containing protein [Ciceribacter lividus]
MDASGNVAATCTAGTGPTARRMTLAGSHVTYGLFKDAARSQPWGSSAPIHTAASKIPAT